MARRVIVGLVAFPLSFALALASVSARNFVAQRQGVFVNSAYRGNVNAMRITYLLGVDVNEPDCKYHTCQPAIVAAGMGGRDDAVRFLLDKGADVNAHEPRGQTALMEAAYLGHRETVRLLLSQGADVNVASDYGTPLTWAQAGWNEHQPEIVDMLRRAGARE